VGEFTRAHGGILFADELGEWSRDAREALRIPLERSWVRVSRAEGAVTLPAKFLLWGTTNHCPCGEYGSLVVSCKCLPQRRLLYQRRLSGALLDRVDLVVDLMESPIEVKSREERSLLPEREWLARMRESFIRLWGKVPGEWDPEETEDRLEAEAGLLRSLETQAPNLNLRSRHRVGRVAMTTLGIGRTPFLKIPSSLRGLRRRIEAEGVPGSVSVALELRGTRE
jgi:magnesium chelatase family protein